MTRDSRPREVAHGEALYQDRAELDSPEGRVLQSLTMRIDASLTPQSLAGPIRRMWDLSAAKIRDTARSYDAAKGSPVFTAGGRWTSRGWTEWTQGFQYGSDILQFDATGEAEFLAQGRTATVERMAPTSPTSGCTTTGSTTSAPTANLLRLAAEGRFEAGPWEIGSTSWR